MTQGEALLLSSIWYVLWHSSRYVTLSLACARAESVGFMSSQELRAEPKRLMLTSLLHPYVSSMLLQLVAFRYYTKKHLETQGKGSAGGVSTCMKLVPVLA